MYYSISYQNTPHPTIIFISNYSLRSFSFLYVKVSLNNGIDHINHWNCSVILNLQPNISTFHAHHVTPYTLNELFRPALPWEYDEYVPPTKRTILVSSTRDTRCSYYHTRSHKRLTHTYPSSCRIPPSHSSISSIFHKHIYILSSSQHFATLFKYTTLATFLQH